MKVLEAHELVQILKKGSAGIFPTDTLPALGACPRDAAQLWKIKRRPLQKPLILMGALTKDLLDFVLPEAFDDAYRMASRYWPGALTMVLPSNFEYINVLNPESSTLGFRVPNCEIARSFLEMTGPLATTSANLSGDLPSLDLNEVSKSLTGIPLLGPLPWPPISGQASTVILWKGLGCWQILRRGVVMPEEV